MADGQEVAKEQGMRALMAWLRMSLPEDQVQKILTSGTLYNYYAQLFSGYIASGQIDPQSLLQAPATTPEQQAAASKLTQSQAELSNWLLRQYKEKYIPWRITNEGLTEDEADILYGELRDELFPKIPQTQEEKISWFQKTFGQAPPYRLDESGAMVVDWQAIDSSLAAKGAQPTPVTQTRQYRDFTGWRENQLSAQEKQTLQVEESQARQKIIQASQVAQAYGIPQTAIQGLAPDMADQWMQAQFETQMARGQQQTGQQQQQQADLAIAMREAESRRIAAQEQAGKQKAIQRVQAQLEESLLPMPDLERAYGKTIKGLVSPAMRQFYKGKAGEVFEESNIEEAMLQWWKRLNQPMIEEAQTRIQDIESGGYRPSDWADISGLQEEFGLSREDALSAVERYATPGGRTAQEFETLPTGGRAALESALAPYREEEERRSMESGAVSRSLELAKQPSPWENFLAGKDWFREFFTTPRAYRPGGYTQRSLAPSIRRF